MSARDHYSWTEWLCGILMQHLAGSGIRASAEYVPPVYSAPDEDHPMKEPRLVTDEKIKLCFVKPLEWRCSRAFSPDLLNVGIALDLADQCRRFSNEVWDDDALSCNYHLVLEISANFEFYSERTHQKLYRITRVLVENEIGPKNCKKIEVYEDFLLVYTRVGTYRISYNDYIKQLGYKLPVMRAMMRRPIRYQYLRELRRNKRNGKQIEKQS